MESKSIFYGCYNQGYKKMYRWECKAFQNQEDADQFSIENAEKSDFQTSFIISASSYIPKFIHKFFIQRHLSSLFGKIDLK